MVAFAYKGKITTEIRVEGVEKLVDFLYGCSGVAERRSITPDNPVSDPGGVVGANKLLV
jgi:hypothetical protein